MSDQTEETGQKSAVLKWFSRLGFAGFMFFLIKGLVWLAIFLVPAYFAC